MGIVARDIPTLILMLLPGFISAGIVYAFTAHPKTSEFERLVQALIFTSLLKVSSYFLRGGLLFVGRNLVSIGHWTSETEFTWSVILAIPLGLFFVWAANTDSIHLRMREWRLTSRTSDPSEWFGTFRREQRKIILHIRFGEEKKGLTRRLEGWPEDWPDQSDKGHFVLSDSAWLLETNERAPLYLTAKIMVPASDVKMVEFLNEPAEVTQSAKELERVERLLVETNEGEENDGSEDSATGSATAGHD